MAYRIQCGILGLFIAAITSVILYGSLNLTVEYSMLWNMEEPYIGHLSEQAFERPVHFSFGPGVTVAKIEETLQQADLLSQGQPNCTMPTSAEETDILNNAEN